MIDTYLTYLRDVRRVAQNTARELRARPRRAGRRSPRSADAPVESLERHDLEAFVRELMTRGLAPRSVARTVASVRGFYRFVALEQKREESAAADLRAPRAWPALPKFLYLDEVDRLLAQPDTVDAARAARQGADRSALRQRHARLGAGRAASRAI